MNFVRTGFLGFKKSVYESVHKPFKKRSRVNIFKLFFVKKYRFLIQQKSVK